MKGLEFDGAEEGVVGVEGGVHVAAGLIEVFEMAGGAGGFGLQQVVADEGAGEVEIGADFLEQAVAGEEVAADDVVAGLDGVENVDGVEAADGHKQEEPAESGEEDSASAGAGSGKAGRGFHFLRGGWWGGAGLSRPCFNYKTDEGRGDARETCS